MKPVYVISLPDCTKCDEVKELLKKDGIPYTEKSLTSELQTDLVMNNVYFNPPIVVIGDVYLSYKDFKEKKDTLFSCDAVCTGCEDSTLCCQK